MPRGYPKNYTRIKKSPEELKFFATWYRILDRCNNSKNSSFHNYGLRGIKCLWASYEDFKKDMYTTFLAHNTKYGGRNTSIERIDVNGNYSRENCTWATISEQLKNKRKGLRLGKKRGAYRRRCTV